MTLKTILATIVELESKLMPELLKSYKVLHHDEYPIVFYGKNFEGGNIIGSFIFEDEETDTLLFFVCEVTKHTLLEFLRKNISYRYVMVDATKISMVTTDYFYHIEKKRRYNMLILKQICCHRIVHFALLMLKVLRKDISFHLQICFRQQSHSLHFILIGPLSKKAFAQRVQRLFY